MNSTGLQFVMRWLSVMIIMLIVKVKSDLPFQGGTSCVDHLCYLCLVFVMLSRLFIAAFWSPAGKGLTSWCRL